MRHRSPGRCAAGVVVAGKPCLKFFFYQSISVVSEWSGKKRKDDGAKVWSEMGPKYAGFLVQRCGIDLETLGVVLGVTAGCGWFWWHDVGGRECGPAVCNQICSRVTI